MMQKSIDDDVEFLLECIKDYGHVYAPCYFPYDKIAQQASKYSLSIEIQEKKFQVNKDQFSLKIETVEPLICVTGNFDYDVEWDEELDRYDYGCSSTVISRDMFLFKFDKNKKIA